MRKKILAAIGAPILLASSALAGGAAFHGAPKPLVKTVQSDHVVFHGTIQLLPTPDKPSMYVITMDQPIFDQEHSCVVASDAFFIPPPAGEGTLPCTITSHGTVTTTKGVMTFHGSTTVTSDDGTQQFSGILPIGRAGTVTPGTGHETDTDGSITPISGISGSMVLDFKNIAPIIQVVGDFYVLEHVSAADPD